MAIDIDRLTRAEIEERKKNIWKALNKYGIYTMEEFDEAYANMKPIDVGCMTAPTKKVEGVKMPKSFRHCDCEKCGFQAWSLKKECKCYNCGAIVYTREQTPDEISNGEEVLE